MDDARRKVDDAPRRVVDDAPRRVRDDAPRRVVVNDVEPVTPDRVSAAKATVGHRLVISANVFADGHDVVAARVRWRVAGGSWTVVPMAALGNDRYETAVTPAQVGAHEFEIDGWVDPHGTWRHRIETGMDSPLDRQEGAALVERELDRLPADLAVEARDVVAGISPMSEALSAALSALPDRRLTTTSGPWPVWVDRERAAVGAWYELFPRNYGGFSGTAKRLPAIAAMGFDVVYLPPIHPIGRTARKGRGNTLVAGPDDPGSPWAIGSSLGGHDAIEPCLGTLSEFDDLVAEAQRLGMEIALDYALQCSPDHPWVRDHPAWFGHRADGSIRFAENPPKQYQDIYPLSFYPEDERERVAMWRACLDVLQHWIGHGVRIFRVDNPHTKPFALWSYLIGSVHERHPDVVFLAEAFTRPAVMRRLAEIGFSQSYTYFTWRTSKDELTEFGTTLVGDIAIFRPNLWPNTPDILSGPLRDGPPAAFRIRSALAATMGPSWGMYSGYELCENQPASDTNEEYFASEKYELKDRDWDDPRSIAPWITRLNLVRRRHRALADLRTLRFHHADNPYMIVYSKQVDGDVVLTVVNLDPSTTHEATLWIDLGALGLPWDAPLAAHDEMTGTTFDWWGPSQYVRLGPDVPAHVIALRVA